MSIAHSGRALAGTKLGKAEDHAPVLGSSLKTVPRSALKLGSHAKAKPWPCPPPRVVADPGTGSGRHSSAAPSIIDKLDSMSNIVQSPGLKPSASKMSPMDGCEATATVAYELSDVTFIYPITPSTPMGEYADQWASDGKINAFGNVMSVTEMESETGAAGALHGALAAGSLCTTFTCSQGLLLMIPNMYKIAGELMPCVIHVTARSLARHALSIFGDHQDVMAVRQVGWNMLCSNSVQEAQDMALISHLATLRCSIPVVHFFDGFRTSHEINKITTIDPADIKQLISQPIYQAAIRHHHERALNPTHPHQRGTAQGPDVYFQSVEAAEPFYAAAPAAIIAAMEEVGELTGRQYKPYDYVGHPEAERVIIMMGSGCTTVEEATNVMVAEGQKVGLLKVRMFRPWSAEHFLSALPTTVDKICVMDRTKEPGALADPLYLDVVATVGQMEMLAHSTKRTIIVGGRYGLSSKEFTPSMAIAIYDNLKLKDPRNKFTIGIVDDVMNSHLPYTEGFNGVPVGTSQCMFWGMGSDGTVGANKEAIKIIADNTDLYTQAYFFYDAHKSGGVTVSHLRFGPTPIGSSYLVEQADYMAVNHMSYMQKYDVMSKLAPGGVLVLNSIFTDIDQLEAFLPDKVKRDIAKSKAQVYVIDALTVAKNVGLGKRVNMVMQLSNVLPIERAITLLKKSIVKAYSKKGPAVVAMNHAAVDDSVAQLKKLEIPAHWANLETAVVSPTPAAKAGSYSSKMQFIEELDVSGFVPPGTTVIERRAIASTIPVWKADACTQCNICSYICPHAAIRPFLATDDELVGAPESFNVLQARGPGLGGYKYRLQVSPMDCTGCQLCVHVCPDNALVDKPIAAVGSIEDTHWTFATQEIPERNDVLDRASVKGSQLQKPLLEFSGACEGCGETPYVKLLTQLFGERLIIANATGCSSIWGGSAPSNPYTTNSDGFGPAWANSLFEDNAQFGLGIAMATVQRRKTLQRHVVEALDESSEDVMKAVRAEKDSHAKMDQLAHESDLFLKPSIWIVGGDGWAYDIGFGGLDHVMSTGEDVNILILDTEMYSNTGGQKSKSTPLGAVTKFAAGGKTRPKKDMGGMAMSYGDVYVASTCLQSNFGQAVKAMAEAEKYNGVSIMINYAPCVMHGIEGGMCNALDDAKEATETGYWPLYRYDPSIVEDGKKHRFMLDSKKLKGDLEHLLHHENRFAILDRKDPATADRLHRDLSDMNIERLERFKGLAAGTGANPRLAMEQIEVLQKKDNLPVGDEDDEHHTPITGPVTERPVGPGGSTVKKGGFAKPSHFT
eukprot:gene15524-21612_t